MVGTNFQSVIIYYYWLRLRLRYHIFFTLFRTQFRRSFPTAIKGLPVPTTIKGLSSAAHYLSTRPPTRLVVFGWPATTSTRMHDITINSRFRSYLLYGHKKRDAETSALNGAITWSLPTFACMSLLRLLTRKQAVSSPNSIQAVSAIQLLHSNGKHFLLGKWHKFRGVLMNLRSAELC